MSVADLKPSADTNQADLTHYACGPTRANLPENMRWLRFPRHWRGNVSECVT